ncbi:polyketide synthase [Chloropicon primus]|uniref:Polyketide synthase n=1 Tax=Chloropicon primus TaxID=1764295 RepID=A0A5B8MIQ5_9CHLO|nr:polyketide synthase [Chloropicon primus]|eukprot:QDZ20181.1 polyketide synthase [Chloropicon primus]
MPSQVCYLVGSFSTKDSQKQVVGTSCTKDLISRVPTGRWDRMWDNSIDVLPHFGFFLAEVESFDPQLFRISESEAVEMDPQQRQLLQSWSNCHHAMSIPKETAVFVGVSQLDYSILLWAIRLRNSKLGTSTFSATSSHLSVVSGRLSYSFGYTGQCLSIDTACSSSLVVVHLATNAMKNDDVRSAGISGVNLLIARTWSQACHSAGMLSMDGRCKVLDESADGYVRSEECASAYLSCDPRYGSYSIVILSSAVNQDGRSSTLTAPNGPAQQSVVSRAFTESRSPVFLQRLQMHGTGTSLGDPIEVGAILAVSDNFDDQSGRPLELQAGKSQHGHSEPAAGLSALLTSLTAGLKSENAEICHLISLNPHVSHLLDSTTTSRNLSAPRSQQAQPTPNDDATGSCGVSAFAFQGTNAHVQFSCGSGKDFVHKVNVNSEPTFLWAIGGVSLSSNFCFVHHTFHDAVFDFNLKINDTDSFNVLSDGRKEAFSLFFIQNLAWSCLYELYRNQMCITNSCLHSSLLLSRKMPSMCLKIQVSSNSQCSIFSNESSQRMVADSLISSALPSSESRATLGKRNEPLDSEESTETILHSKVTLASANIFVALEQAHKVCNNHRDLNPVTMKMIMIKEGLLSERNDSANGCFGKAGYRCTKSVQVCSSTAEVLAEVNDVQYGSSYKLQVLRKDNIQEDKFVYSSMWIANSTDEEIEVSSRRKVMDVAKSESITTYALSSISLLQRMQMKDSIASTFTSTSSAPPVLGPASSDGLQGVMASVLTALCRVYENTIGKVAMITMYDIHNEYGTRHSSFTHERQIVQDKYARLLKASISYTPRLCPVQISTFSNQHMKGTTMITGGTGALGNIIKDLLQKKCKAFTYLLGRTKRITKIRKYENIIQISTNVSFAEDCHLLGGLGVQGVMHAGGVLADSVLSNQTAQSVKQVFAPKVVGLHQLAKTFAMEAMGAQVLFSSVAALLGSAGQTNYAAANAVLDAQAHMWQNAGVSAVSVQWGPWASGGMAVKHAKRMEQMGLYMLSPYEGLFALESIAGRVCGGGGCLDNAMWSSHAQVAVQRFMWDRFLSRMTHVPPLFSNMHDTASHGHGSSIDATRMSNTSASAASGMTLDADVLQQKVKDAVHAVVGHEVSPDDPLMAAGLDSLGAMELRSSLEQSLGIDLPGMLIFDYPSVHAIIEYAETLLGPKQVPLASAAISTGIRTVSEGSVSVHMLSLAARLPTPEHNLCQTSNAGDSVWRVPHMRWDADEDYKDGAPIVPIRFGGFLDGIELFDIPCFGVSRSEACWMDPHQRLLLEVSYEALHSMESDSSSSWMHQKQRMGVMVGTQHLEYRDLMGLHSLKMETYSVTAGSLSVSAGRLSFTYGLQGACAAVDTACSASLVAMHLSFMGLRAGELSSGLVCGIDLHVCQNIFSIIQRAGMLAPDGRCKTLDASADGYVRAEACIACVLGPLEDGSKQDTVMLRGTAVNQDGRSSALTAPHGPSQQQVMRMSLHSADLDAWNVQVLQMHGTGTPLGDPIEVGAASAVLLSEATKRDFPVHMSGVKSNIGHTECAAGMAGMVQLAGNLMHKSASAISHLRHLNHHILSMVGGAVDLSRQSSSLACGDVCIGEVGAFAFQGTNAHALLSHCSGSVGNIDTVSRPGLVMLWQRERCWYVCKLPKLLSRVAFAQGGDISLEGMLNRVQHAFIWQHLFNGRPIAGMGSLIEMCAGTIDVLRSGGKNEKTDSYVMRNLTMPAPIVLDDSTSQTVNVLVQRKNEISVVCGGSSQSKTCLAGTTQWAPSTNHHSEDDVQKHTRVFDTDLSNASPSATYLGYMLPNINEMVSSEDGYVVNPVHLAMCLGLGEWSHLSGLACGADAMRMGTSSYSSAGDWLCLANRGKSSRTEMSRFGAVELNGTLHRKDLSVPLSRMRSSADLSEQVQYTLSWQSVCPVISSAQVLDDMSASSCHVWSGGDADSFVEQKSCLLDHPASLVALSLSTIAVLQDKYNQMSSCDLKLVSKSTTSTSCGVPAPFVGDQGNAMIYGILRACALNGVQSTSLHFGSHDTSNKVDESCLPLSEIHNGGGWCVYVDQSMVETAAMVPCFPHSSQSLSSVAGSWVVTGGTGALGLLTGQHLTQHGIDCVLMLGRTGHIKSMSKGLCGHSCGAEVQILHCDVSCAEDCHLLGGLGVQGVMHAGGVLADSVLSNQTAQSVKQVFAPKVVGLHQLAKTFAMEAMGAQVLFSSVAALLGSAGQTNYAAANAVLDAQAHMWQNAGVSAVSVQWGPWASGGMAVKHAKRMEQMGLYMLSPYEGLFALQSIAGRVCGGGGCLDNAMWSSHAQVAVQRFMWDRFLSRMTHVPPLFSNMHDTASHGHGSSIDATRMSNTSASAASGMTLDADVLQQKVKDAVHAVVGHEVSPDDPLMAAGLDSLGAMELRSSLEQSLGIDLPGMLIFDYPSVHAIIEYAESFIEPRQSSGTSGMDADVLQQKVKEAVHAVVGHDTNPDEPLMAAGLDSLGAMELRSSLEQSLGIDLPGMLIFDYPSVHAIIEYAETLLGPKQVPLASAAISTGIRTVSEGSVSVHMLSLAARLPTPEHNLCQTSNAGDSIWRVPHMRWDADEDYKDGAPIVPIRFGGFLDGIELFDIPCFGVSRSEACWMDPHQRLLLEVSYEALHSMESDSSSSWMHQKQRMGVMVGTQHVEYSNIYAGYGISLRFMRLRQVLWCFCRATVLHIWFARSLCSC